MPAATENRAIRLALLGYGKMGKMLAQLAPERGCEVCAILEIDRNADGAAITRENFKDIDVAVDFTVPGAVVENVRRLAALGVNIVVGTTGWNDHLAEVRAIIEKTGAGMVYAPNFSIGVQLFYRIARAAAEQFSRFPHYAPYVIEAHHQAKKDAPSGTALELKRQVQPFFGSREIPVSSVRAGFIPGAHELGFDSEADTLIVRHTARSRRGFAEGALLAARWVAGKQGLFTFADVLELSKEG